MAKLSAFETKAVLEVLRRLLTEAHREGVSICNLALNATSTEVERKKRAAGKVVDVPDGYGRLQRSLSRYKRKSPKNGLTEGVFSYLVRDFNAFRHGWGDQLASARAGAARVEMIVGIEFEPGWFAVPTAEDFLEVMLGSKAAPSLPDSLLDGLVLNRGETISARPKRGTARTQGKARYALADHAEQGGIPDDVLMAARCRILAPFYGHERSGGGLLQWTELSEPALKRAIRASIEVERIWLGLPVEGIRWPTKKQWPLRKRLKNKP